MTKANRRTRPERAPGRRTSETLGTPTGNAKSCGLDNPRIVQSAALRSAETAAPANQGTAGNQAVAEMQETALPADADQQLVARYVQQSVRFHPAWTRQIRKDIQRAALDMLEIRQPETNDITAQAALTADQVAERDPDPPGPLPKSRAAQ